MALTESATKPISADTAARTPATARTHRSAIKEAIYQVFLRDEVDKVGADWRGRPSSALLEVPDTAQNDSFRDH